jgi:NAD(P)H-dependent flavin oxidoreductase YrpB (nitropropane dioxygenase family)
MLRTRFCELFEIDVSILQAPIWPATSPELVAAVAEGGALGRIGAVFGSAEHVRGQIDRVRELTPVTGQSAGLVDEVRPAAEIVREMVTEAEDALERALALRGR